ncbi:MAG: hypothetical protein HN764_04960 [Gammaproteobacteria bacterium]|nr:hypothetical protein [Gammaproteobacteria bacterium]
MKRFLSPISAIFLCLSTQFITAEPTEIVFAYIGDTEHSAYSGISQGLHEANIQGQFLGQKYTLETFSDASELPGNTDKFLAFLSAQQSEGLMDSIERAKQHPVFNLVAENDELREACHSNMLSIIPSNKMKEDAAAQWRSKHPESTINPLAWHHNFNKFAARDLNKRFRKAFDKNMDDYAWAGWAAIRMSADTVAREAIADPVILLNHLKTNLSFDGQKGLDMDFRETGQLRQLILIVSDNKPVGEAPVRGVSNDIDSLGIRECAK